MHGELLGRGGRRVCVEGEVGRENGGYSQYVV